MMGTNERAFVSTWNRRARRGQPVIPGRMDVVMDMAALGSSAGIRAEVDTRATENMARAGSMGKGTTGKPKGKGKWSWHKWSGNHHGDHGWNGWDGRGSSTMVLKGDNKGGYYLPGGQGYLDTDGKLHPHLGLNQC